jgi:hypothetical protein
MTLDGDGGGFSIYMSIKCFASITSNLSNSISIVGNDASSIAGNNFGKRTFRSAVYTQPILKMIPKGHTLDAKGMSMCRNSQFAGIILVRKFLMKKKNFLTFTRLFRVD